MKNELGNERKWTFVHVLCACFVCMIIALCFFYVCAWIELAFRPRRDETEGWRRNQCINNLRLIDSAKQGWAVENHKEPTNVPTAADLAHYIGRGPAHVLPICPFDPAQSFATSYSINAVKDPPTCKIQPQVHRLR